MVRLEVGNHSVAIAITRALGPTCPGAKGEAWARAARAGCGKACKLFGRYSLQDLTSEREWNSRMSPSLPAWLDERLVRQLRKGGHRRAWDGKMDGGGDMI